MDLSPTPHFPITPNWESKSSLIKLQPNGWRWTKISIEYNSTFENTLAGCEVMSEQSIVNLLPKPQMGKRRSNTIRAVVKRPDHHSLWWWPCCCRKRILQEKGFSQIEHYCYEEHDQLRCAAVECICNMAVDEEVEKNRLSCFCYIKCFIN